MTRSIATTDPVGLVADLPLAGLLVLTGSTNVLLLTQRSDLLAGRMAILRLHPLAQCEIERTRPLFLEQLFGAGFKLRPF